jgi:predicted RNase H-like nuclease (RuvC/YqgF family)
VAKEQLNDTDVKVSELHENLDKMQDVGREKLKYELELMAWEQDAANLEKTIQEEKYRIEIE